LALTNLVTNFLRP